MTDEPVPIGGEQALSISGLSPDAAMITPVTADGIGRDGGAGAGLGTSDLADIKLAQPGAVLHVGIGIAAKGLVLGLRRRRRHQNHESDQKRRNSRHDEEVPWIELNFW